MYDRGYMHHSRVIDLLVFGNRKQFLLFTAVSDDLCTVLALSSE